ncbi:hypothetical protein [Bradyrhizobium sp. WSM1417]|uniref:hypothetical protein n=1 Tax=Bradyrhizobium sp. WSM1417 TaxID=754500 RepID=UPI00047F5DA6|nr:hypothetical protein [Bradyrhizobium sp. WSM1417]
MKKVVAVLFSAVLVVLLLSPALAFIRGQQSGFSGGRTQIGLNGIGFTGEGMYLNILKISGNWNWADNASGGPGPDMLDSNGYPIFKSTYLGNSCGSGGICHGGIKTVTEVPPCATRSCSYVPISTGTCTWSVSGSGSMSVSGVNTVGATFTATPTFLSNLNASQVTFQITATDATTPCTSLAVVHVDDVVGADFTNYTTKAGTAVGKFGSKFLSRLVQAKFAVIRFMNSQNTNASNVTRWEDRTPQNYVFYNAYTYNAAYYTGASTNSGTLGNDFAVSLGSGGPVDKQPLHVLIGPDGKATSTGSTISGSVLTVAGYTGGTYAVGQRLSGTGVDANLYIASLGTGTGQNGTYNLSQSASTVAVGQSITGWYGTRVVGTTAASCSLSWPAHGVSVNDPIGFYSSGTIADSLPFYSGGNYYVVSVPDADHVTVSNTVGGTCLQAAVTRPSSTIAIRQPTLSLNGSTPITIKNMYSNTLTGPNAISGANTENPESGRIGTFVYDDDLKSYLMFGGTQGDGLFNQGIINGIPIEDCLLLATYVGAHPWFVQPFLTSNASAGAAYPNWINGLATYLKANMPAWMIPRIEPVVNEDWNSLFYGTSYSNNKASVYWGTPTSPNLNDYNNYYGYAASLSGQAVNAVFGGSVPRDGKRYQVPIGVQQTSSPSSNDARLASTKFLSSGPTPPAGFVQEAAYKWVTHEAPANYYGLSLGAAALVQTAYLYSTGDATQLTSYVASTGLSNPPNGGSIPVKVASFLDHYQWGQGTGAYTGKPWALDGIAIRQTAYEGGWSPPYVQNTVPGTLDFTTSSASVNSSSPVTSVSKAAAAVLAMPTTTTPFGTVPNTGNGAVVGMPIRIVNAAGGDFTKLNSSRQTVTFTNSSCDISLTANGYVANEAAVFNTSGSLGASLTAGAAYFIVNPTTNAFQVSLTKGGSCISINTAGISGSNQVTPGWFVNGVGGALGANNISLDVDTSAYTGTYAASSASAVYINDGNNNSMIMLASLSASNAGSFLAGNGSAFYDQLIANGCEFPSQFDMAGNNATLPWSPLYPNVYVTPDPSYWTAISAYNH